MVDDRRVEMVSIRDRLNELEARMEKLEASVAKILSILELAEGFFKVAGWIGTCMKVLVGIGAVVVVIYNMFFHPTPK